MNINFPTPPERVTGVFMQMLFSILKRAFNTVVSSNEAVGRIMLLSPDGKAWEVTIDNSGNLQTAVNDGKSRL
jgi:hypothetical protein